MKPDFSTISYNTAPAPAAPAAPATAATLLPEGIAVKPVYTADDVAGLAAAIPAAAALNRHDARARAEQVCSVDRMVDEYEELYRSTLESASAPESAHGLAIA